MKKASVSFPFNKKNMFAQIQPIIANGINVILLVLLLVGCKKDDASTVQPLLTDDSKITYTGTYSIEVNKLLSLSKPWKIPSTDGGNDFQYPRVFPNSCIRDQYVQAAINAAFVVEYKSRYGHSKEADEYAKVVKQTLDYANQLCSNSPTTCGGDCNCSTKLIWPCSATTSGPTVTTPSTTTTTPPNSSPTGKFDFTLNGQKLVLERAMLENTSTFGYLTVRLIGLKSNAKSSDKYDYIYLGFDKEQNPTVPFATSGIPIPDGATVSMDPSKASKSLWYTPRVYAGIQFSSTQTINNNMWHSRSGYGESPQLPGKYSMKRIGNTYEITVEGILELEKVANSSKVTLKGTYRGVMEL